MSDLDDVRLKLNSIISEIGKVVVGKRDVVRLAVATLVIEGHLLIEGFPGTGKTLLARSLARAIGGKFKRIQGHPDVLPSDITGFHVYRLDGSKSLIPGPIMSNIVLFDELNRTPTRSQSALIEPMQEYQVTIDGTTYPLPRPFMLIATEVPAEYALGSYKVMETVADRFAVKVKSGYNPASEEMEIVRNIDAIESTPVETVVSVEEVKEIKDIIARHVYISDDIVSYIVNIINYIRNDSRVLYGPSHRAAIHLAKIARVIAVIQGRDYVIPDDVKEVAVNVIAHRIYLKGEFEIEEVAPESIVEEALNRVPVPK